MWTNWTNAVLGLIVLGVALFAGLSLTLAWTFGVLGALVALIGFIGAASPQSILSSA